MPRAGKMIGQASAAASCTAETESNLRTAKAAGAVKRRKPYARLGFVQGCRTARGQTRRGLGVSRHACARVRSFRKSARRSQRRAVSGVVSRCRKMAGRSCAGAGSQGLDSAHRFMKILFDDVQAAVNRMRPGEYGNYVSELSPSVRCRLSPPPQHIPIIPAGSAAKRASGSAASAVRCSPCPPAWARARVRKRASPAPDRAR